MNKAQSLLNLFEGLRFRPFTAQLIRAYPGYDKFAQLAKVGDWDIIVGTDKHDDDEPSLAVVDTKTGGDQWVKFFKSEEEAMKAVDSNLVDSLKNKSAAQLKDYFQKQNFILVG